MFRYLKRCIIFKLIGNGTLIVCFFVFLTFWPFSRWAQKPVVNEVLTTPINRVISYNPSYPFISGITRFMIGSGARLVDFNETLLRWSQYQRYMLLGFLVSLEAGVINLESFEKDPGRCLLGVVVSFFSFLPLTWGDSPIWLSIIEMDWNKIN